MKAVFLLQWRRFYRKPLLVVTMFGLTVIFVSVSAAGNQGGPQAVPLYADQSLTEREANDWLERLNDDDRFAFELMPESRARTLVADGNVGHAVKLLTTDYRLLVGREDPNRFVLDSYLRRTYSEELSLQRAEQAVPGIREQVESSRDNPPLTLTVTSRQGEEDSFQYNGELQLLFGMTLFFVIYTIMFSLVRIVDEKRTGTWSRMIISPVRKWQIYLGHLGYSFLVGFSQITLIFLLFRFAFGFDLGDHFWLLIAIAACYTFSIVALGLLIISLVTKPQQLGAVIPIIATGMAMVGGAFWPIELVSNEILLAIAKVLPITYGIEALTTVAVYGEGVEAILLQLAVLIGFGAICMVIGIRLLEWRSAS
ncbi:ABC transporter permease [Planococcus salinarum]|uniref:ABC transporter permease n=1 Tax=Planococcus salinarum TaxID=622695 RepID=UPI000E3CC5AA|nr:ABC transporter permease [Planococcus salinarum]TAA73234.1 ABC transporter permease [Planococcus salinarum]